MQVDVSKAFDKAHRDALASFAETIIEPAAPEAAAFIKYMYDGDKLALRYGEAFNMIEMKSGIRQGDPLSPALFSALTGHILGPLISRWKNKGWGAEVDPTNPNSKITILAYADDVTIFAATEAQASIMLNEMTGALGGFSPQLLPKKCSALWSRKPNGSETSVSTAYPSRRS